MPKDIPVSNGNLLFNFDLDYQIRDVYFPMIGQENHSKGLPFRFGVWADGAFSWMGPEWEKDLRYYDDNLVTQVTLRNPRLNLEIRCSDVVDMHLNLYLKRLVIASPDGKEREVRLFFHHEFHIYGNDIGDTAYFDPRTQSVIHYKGHRYFLVNCCSGGKWGAEHFTCGGRKNPAMKGTWTDAEDGKLRGKPIGWGIADSTVGICTNVPKDGSATAFYSIAAGTRYAEVADINHELIERGPEVFITRTSNYWMAWARKEPRFFADLPKSIGDIFNRTLLILRTQIDNRGAIIAANDSDIVHFGRDTYSYMWGRDGGFVAVALAKAGYPEACRKFFEFCAKVLTEEGYLFQHYNPDGTLASNWQPWMIQGKEVLPIQEDSTALVLWALWTYYTCSKNLEFVNTLYRDLILRAADFLVHYRDPQTQLPTGSYDLWEERYATHTYTAASVIAGLRAAGRFARLFNDAALAESYENSADIMKEAVLRFLYDPRLERFARSGKRKGTGYELNGLIDISLLALVTLADFSPKDPRVERTFDAVVKALWVDSPIGGCARKEADHYQRTRDFPQGVPGNPWPIATLWIAEYLIMRAGNMEQLHEAVPYIEWCAKTALPSGVLAEQVHPSDGRPLSVSPLTWSHSAFVWTVMLYTEKYTAIEKKIRCPVEVEV
jgi:glucoamylase